MGLEPPDVHQGEKRPLKDHEEGTDLLEGGARSQRRRANELERDTASGDDGLLRTAGNTQEEGLLGESSLLEESPERQRRVDMASGPSAGQDHPAGTRRTVTEKAVNQQAVEPEGREGGHSKPESQGEEGSLRRDQESTEKENGEEE